jgi:N-methylhydantoinase B/oxoprolinase/acetone carboxylase alpha subunit
MTGIRLRRVGGTFTESGRPFVPHRTASPCGGGWVQASRVVVNDLFSGGADEGARGGPAATSERGPSARPLEPGDVVAVFTPGGGGWGR